MIFIRLVSRSSRELSLQRFCVSVSFEVVLLSSKAFVNFFSLDGVSLILINVLLVLSFNEDSTSFTFLDASVYYFDELRVLAKDCITMAQ